MQFIVHFPINNIASNLIFNTGRKMLYCLEEEMYISGIGYTYHYMIDEYSDRTFEVKINTLIKNTEGHEKKELEEFYRNYKYFKKLKNKDSKSIVQTNLAKREVEGLYSVFVKGILEKMETLYATTTFKDLHDCQKVYFYGIEDDNLHGKRDNIIPIDEILSLQIADDEDIPLLSIANEDDNGQQLFDFETNDISKNDYNNGYLVDVFQFPCFEDVRAAELKAIAHKFSKEIQPIKEQLKKWATLSFRNSNSKEAQQFFIKNISPMIEKYRKTGLQMKETQEVQARHSANYTFHLQFGEIPIDKIWEHYKIYNYITEEQYQRLVKLKEVNPKRYSGRWPVVFFKSDYKKMYLGFTTEEEQEQVPAPRKTLNID